MNFDWLKRIFATRVKQNPVGPLTVQRFAGNDEQPHDYDVDSHIVVYVVDVYAFAAMRAIAADIAATPITVQRRTRRDGEYVWEDVDDHELLDLLTRPNQQEDWQSLCERWTLQLLGTGDGYLIHDPTEAELYTVNPTWVKIKADKKGRVMGYSIKNLGLSYDADASEIIHARLANPNGDFYGMPPSEVIKKTIVTKLALNSYLKAFFKNMGQLGTVLTTEQALGEEQAEAIAKRWKRAHGGGTADAAAEKAFSVTVLSNGTSVSQNAPLIKDLVPDAVDRIIRQEVCAAYGVPPVKITILDEATYNNAKEQINTYQRGTVDPLRRRLASALNLRFAPSFGDELRIWFDTSNVPGMQEDVNEIAKRAQLLYSSRLVTKNEAREMVGLDAVEGGEDFDEPVAIDPSFGGGGDGSDDDEAGAGDRSSRKHLMPSGMVAYKDARADLWKQHDRRLTKREGNYAKDLARYFEGQVKRIIAKLREETGNGKMMSRLGIWTKADDDGVPLGSAMDIFNIEQENAKLVAELKPVIRMTIDEAGRDAFGGFNVKNPNVQVAIEAFTNRLKKINDTSYDRIRALLSDAYDAGDSIQTVERALRDMFDDWSKTRATMVARTEMNGMVNSGAMLGYDQGGIRKKEWLSTRDANVRDTHMSADGQVVATTMPFMVGGNALMYPGDPSGAPEEVINCRCTIVPIVE